MVNTQVKLANKLGKNKLYNRKLSSINLLTSTIFTVCIGIIIPPTQVYAGPTGGHVVGGSGSINQVDQTTNINQSSQRMAINWQTYNVNSNETVNYYQPNSSAVSLNRILDQNPSQIFGNINANGHVILINPNGMVFGQSATVNVGGLVASGLDMDPQAFMNGSMMFNAVDNTDGVVINHGLLNAATGGSISLLGQAVQNDGLITANLGRVNMASGSAAVATFDSDGLIGIEVTQDVLKNDLGIDSATLNAGTIQANGGQVLMTAKVSKDLFSNAVNNSGIVEAHSIDAHNGAIMLGGNTGDVVNSGTLDVSSNQAGVAGGTVDVTGQNITSSGNINANAQDGNGGSVTFNAEDTTLLTGSSVTSARSESNGVGGSVIVQGNHVGLFDQSKVDVSGANGGGQALIGGDYQGKNPDIKNATATYVATDAEIYSDATENGDGGKVVVWSDEVTRYYGDIYARGGIQGGNGGIAETSGKTYLGFSGFVDLTASSNTGLNGSLLLDPRDINITRFTPDVDVSTLPVVNNTVTVAFADPGVGANNDLEVNRGNLVNVLDSGTNVELQASRDINVTDDINSTQSGGGNLTLRANRDITITSNDDITLNGGTLSLYADDDGIIATDQGSRGDVKLFSTLTTNGGDLNISGYNIIGTGERIRTGSGTTTLSADVEINLSSTNNDFNTVIINKASAVNLYDRNSLTLGNIKSTFLDSTNNGYIKIYAEDNLTLNGTVSGDGATMDLYSGYTGNSSRMDLGGATFSGSHVVNLYGGGNSSDTLVGFNTHTTWTTSSVVDAGTIDSTQSGSANYSGFENLQGGDDVDEFYIQDANAISGNVKGGNNNDKFYITAAFSNDIFGEAGDDEFNINVAAFSGTIHGDTGQPGDIGADQFNIMQSLSAGTIDGDGGTDTFNIDNTISGNVSISGGDDGDNFKINANISGNAQLTGDNGDDTFTIIDGVIVDGTSVLDGGSDTDSIVLDNYAVDTTWELTPATTSVSGDIYETNTPANVVVNSFSQIETLYGSDSAAETFISSDSLPDTIVLNGGVNGFEDKLDFSTPFTTATAVTANLANLYELEKVIGTSGDDTLNGANNAKTWIVDGANSGCIINGISSAPDCSGSVEIKFENFEYLNGGDQIDKFHFVSGGSISQTVNGGAGNDIFQIDDGVLVANPLVGGVDTDTLDLSGWKQDLDWLIDPRLVTAPDVYTASGSVNESATSTVVVSNFDEMETFNGSNSNKDTFKLNASLPNGITLNAGTPPPGTNTQDALDFSRVPVGTPIDVNVDGINGIYSVTGTGENGDRLIGSSEHDWIIDGYRSGCVVGVGVTDCTGDTAIKFFEFANLVGGADVVDNFYILNTGIVTSIDGGVSASPTTRNSLNYSLYDNPVNNVVTVDLDATSAMATGVNTITYIDDFVGNTSAGNQFHAANNTAHTWSINSASVGSVDTFTFQDFDTLYGGNDDDNLTIDYNSTSPLTITFYGGTDGTNGDSITLTGSIGANGTDILTPQTGYYTSSVSNGSIDQIINFYDTEHYVDQITANSFDLHGVDNVNDTLTLATGTISGTNPYTITSTGSTPTLEISNKTNFQYHGGANTTDVLDIGSGLTLTQSITQASNNVSVNLASLSGGNLTGNVNGNVVVDATGNLNIGTFNATGNETLNVTSGAVIDAINSAANNITANSLTITASAGIGSNSNAFETNVRNLTLTNTNSGDIVINNTGNLNIKAISNNATTGGNIAVSTTGAINQQGNILVPNAVANVDITALGGKISMVNGTQTKLTNGGNITYHAAGTVDVSTLDSKYLSGVVSITSDTGDILSTRDPDVNKPNIIGDSAFFYAQYGTLGTVSRPLVIQVSGSVFIYTLNSAEPIYTPARPRSIINNSTTLFGINDAKAEIAGNQRTQVDALAIIDPAIFTNVKNYREDDYPVRLPSDQLAEDDEDDKYKSKRKQDPDVFEQEKPYSADDATPAQ